MDKNKEKQLKRNRRRGRVRAKVTGTGNCPRLSVFKSNMAVYAQLIDDNEGKTLVSAHSREVKMDSKSKDKKDQGQKVMVAYELGRLLAEKAQEKKIKTAVFDRGGYKYHGRIKALADGARKGGIEF